MTFEETFQRWLGLKADHVVRLHRKYNPTDGTIPPDMAIALMVSVGTQAREHVAHHYVKKIEQLQADVIHYRSALISRDRQMSKLLRELEGRKRTVTVPNTEGRLFREE